MMIIGKKNLSTCLVFDALITAAQVGKVKALQALQHPSGTFKGNWEGPK